MLVIDEGHKAKNTATKLRKALKDFKVQKQKIILSGTPVQNNLEEFYSIVDLIKDGIFGTLKDFKNNYANPIKAGMMKHASYAKKRKAIRLLDDIKDLYRPHFIRRTKREIFQCKSSEMSEKPLSWNELPLKTDLVIWVPLSDI